MAPPAASVTPKASGVTTASSSGQGAASATSGANTPPPFEQVARGAERLPGWLPVWRRQDKVWVELKPSDFNRPMYLSPRLRTGLGEGGLYGGLIASRFGLVGRPQWVEFRKLHQQVQLVAVNAAFMAEAGTPRSLAVAQAFSPSLLGSVPLASAPRAQDEAVLVELSALMQGDIQGLGAQLNAAFRQGHALDSRNSAVTDVRVSPTGLTLDVVQHFYTPNLSAAAPAPGQSPASPPSGLPDARSLLLNLRYTLAPLPEAMPQPRPADPRVGYFTTTVNDFSNDLARTPRVRHINRWRLDKQDPDAALSPPVRPIVYWLDRSIPTEYRPAIREGVLAWNAAFEAIGIRGALEVREATEQEPQDMVGKGQAIIRWMTNHRPSFGAIGPTHVDPRTGEILTADIGIESLSSRSIRVQRSQILPGLGLSGAPLDASGESAGHLHGDHCQHAEWAAEQLAMGLALHGVDAAAAERPDAPEVQAFVAAYLKDVTLHEVGHTLGLRHNFKASQWRSAAELDQADLTRQHGLAASVMDYLPINLNLPGQPAGAPFQTTLGPYDFWAIEYGYRPLSGSADQQRAALRAVADRAEQPGHEALAYGTDEDNALGLDPTVMVFDLGREPLAFAARRLALSGALLQRAQAQAGQRAATVDDAAHTRRLVGYALRERERAASVLLRQVGGLLTRRDLPGSGRDRLEPVPAAQQQAALQMLLSHWMGAHSLRLSPSLQRQMAPDYFERTEGTGLPNAAPVITDFSVAEQVAQTQRGLLDALMSDALAVRLLDNIDRVRDREARPLTLRALQTQLREVVWQRPDGEPEPWRRNLQREYVNRLAVALVRGGARADVRAQWLAQGRALESELKASVKGNGDALSTEAAHRRDCLETLQRSLQAAVVRTTP